MGDASPVYQIDPDVLARLNAVPTPQQIKAQVDQAMAIYSVPKGYQQLSSDALSSAAGLTIPAGAMRAVIQNNGAQAARWRADGTDPTALIGQRLIGGDAFDVTTPLNAYRFIREAEGVQLDVTYYG